MKGQLKSDSEQRKFARISREIPVEVNLLTYPLSEDSGKKCLSKNISAGGICFTVSNSYQQGNLLSLKIRIPGWEGYKRPFSRLVNIASEEPLTAIGEVVWCQKLSDASEYDVGLKFVNIYEDDYNALMKYVESQKKYR